MTVQTSEIIDILQTYGIAIEEGLSGFDQPNKVEQEFPEVGELRQ